MEPTMVPLEGVFGWILGIAGIIINLFYITLATNDTDDTDDDSFSKKLFAVVGFGSIVLIMIGSGLVTAYNILHYMG